MKIPEVRFAMTSDMVNSQTLPVANFHPAEQHIIEWAAQFLVSGKKFLDIGAHIGSYAVQYAALGFETVAFEACSETCDLLKMSARLNDLKNIEIRNQALSFKHHEGVLRKISKDGGGNSILNLSTHANPLRSEPVLCRTLDEFGIQNIGFIKIDVEGAELDVLKGGLNTLWSSGYPKIIFESWGEYKMPEAKKLRSDLFDFLKKIGYQIVNINGCPEMFLAVYE